MATIETDPEPPYAVQTDGPARSEYMSIPFHSCKQNMSFEELHLEHYNTCHKQSLSDLDDASELMATQWLSSRRLNSPMQPIRAVADGTQKLNGDVIVFLVGRYAPERYSIHERLISPRSEFVRLALRGEWKEAQERTIKLPEDDPAIFSVYQQWLYGGLIRTCCGNSFSRCADDEYETLVKAYILGEKFMDNDFKDAAIDAIVDKLSSIRRFDTRLTTLVFNNTPSESPLRRLWMDVYYHFGSFEWLDADLVGSPINADFMVELSRHQMKFRTGSGSFELTRSEMIFLSCTYHEHGTRPCHRHKLHNIA